MQMLSSNPSLIPNPLHGVGIGLRHRHFREIIAEKPEIPWLEVHTENFFSSGSAASQCLEKIRKDYPLSAHCVGLSLGAAEPVSARHLAQVQNFIERFSPALVSDHLSWGSASGAHVPDLLPLPYTEEALSALVANIGRTQDTLKRRILLENASSYLRFADSALPEWEFFVEAAKRSGCGLLLDINNIYVSCHNHGWDAETYLAAIPPERVGEIHLAGYSVCEVEGQEIYIDTHGAPVYDPVWALFSRWVERFAHTPVLIEWDDAVPELSVLLSEKAKAEKIVAGVRSTEFGEKKLLRNPVSLNSVL